MKFFNVTREVDQTLTGSSLQGYIKTTYADLVEKFGEPEKYDLDKSTAEWCVEFCVDLGKGDYKFVNATIYDWKTDATPMGEYDWHIGGFGFDAVEVIDTYMNGEYSFVGDNGREMGLS
tara:strand:- start:29 stop:385 length:357 start_codon:yes stop_codon:yes gene_type:complete